MFIWVKRVNYSLFFYTIKNFNQDRLHSFFYAICFSILANPSMGTPFPDHYSTFLSLMGIFFFLTALAFAALAKGSIKNETDIQIKNEQEKGLRVITKQFNTKWRMKMK